MKLQTHTPQHLRSAPAQAGGHDADFNCFWIELIKALCPPAAHQGGNAPSAPAACFTPFWSKESSVAYQGQSMAVGEDTYASASMTMNLKDLGFLSITTGASELQAVARSDPGEAVYTDASDAFIPSGADIIFQTTTIVQGSWSDEAGDWSASTSTTSFFAIDFYWFNLPKAWMSTTLDVTTRVHGSFGPGNVAYANAGVTAQGDETFTDFTADVLTIEDTISSATLIGLASALG